MTVQAPCMAAWEGLVGNQAPGTMPISPEMRIAVSPSDTRELDMLCQCLPTRRNDAIVQIGLGRV